MLLSMIYLLPLLLCLVGSVQTLAELKSDHQLSWSRNDFPDEFRKSRLPNYNTATADQQDFDLNGSPLFPRRVFSLSLSTNQCRVRVIDERPPNSAPLLIGFDSWFRFYPTSPVLFASVFTGRGNVNSSQLLYFDECFGSFFDNTNRTLTAPNVTLHWIDQSEVNGEPHTQVIDIPQPVPPTIATQTRQDPFWIIRIVQSEAGSATGNWTFPYLFVSDDQLKFSRYGLRFIDYATGTPFDIDPSSLSLKCPGYDCEFDFSTQFGLFYTVDYSTVQSQFIPSRLALEGLWAWDETESHFVFDKADFEYLGSHGVEMHNEPFIADVQTSFEQVVSDQGDSYIHVPSIDERWNSTRGYLNLTGYFAFSQYRVSPEISWTSAAMGSIRSGLEPGSVNPPALPAGWYLNDCTHKPSYIPIPSFDEWNYYPYGYNVSSMFPPQYFQLRWFGSIEIPPTVFCLWIPQNPQQPFTETGSFFSLYFPLPDFLSLIPMEDHSQLEQFEQIFPTFDQAQLDQHFVVVNLALFSDILVVYQYSSEHISGTLSSNQFSGGHDDAFWFRIDLPNRSSENSNNRMAIIVGSVSAAVVLIVAVAGYFLYRRLRMSRRLHSDRMYAATAPLLNSSVDLRVN